MDPTHPLLPIAVDCLSFYEVERSSSDELCQRLADLKESTQYTQNIEQQQDETQAKDDQIVTLTQQLHERVRVIYQQQNEIMLKKSEIDDWGEPERAPHRRDKRSQSIYVYIYYYVWYVRHPRAAIYNVPQLAIYSGGRMKKLLRSPVPRA